MGQILRPEKLQFLVHLRLAGHAGAGAADRHRHLPDHALQAGRHAGLRFRRIHHARSAVGLAGALYALDRRVGLLHHRLPAHDPRPAVRLVSQAARTDLAVRFRHLPVPDGRSLLRLPAAVGADVVLGRPGDRQPVRRDSLHRPGPVAVDTRRLRRLRRHAEPLLRLPRDRHPAGAAGPGGRALDRTARSRFEQSGRHRSERKPGRRRPPGRLHPIAPLLHRPRSVRRVGVPGDLQRGGVLRAGNGRLLPGVQQLPAGRFAENPAAHRPDLVLHRLLLGAARHHGRFHVGADVRRGRLRRVHLAQVAPVDGHQGHHRGDRAAGHHRHAAIGAGRQILGRGVLRRLGGDPGLPAVARSFQSEIHPLPSKLAQICVRLVLPVVPDAGLPGHAAADRDPHAGVASVHAVLLQLLPADAMVARDGHLQARPGPCRVSRALIAAAQPSTQRTLMNLHKKLLCILALLPGLALAADEGYPLDKAPDRSHNMAALQNGAKLGEMMITAMPPKDAKAWFGTVPPDLSVIARAKSSEAGSGGDYLYTYLRTFYKDDTRPTGWNNAILKNAAMPHVLWQLQGIQTAKMADEIGEDGKTVSKLVGFEQVTPGTMNKLEFDTNVADLVGYMEWMAEPTAQFRKRLGVWVLLFLSGFAILAWRLNASFWKEVK